MPWMIKQETELLHLQVEPNGVGDEKMREWDRNLNRVEEMHVI